MSWNSKLSVVNQGKRTQSSPTVDGAANVLHLPISHVEALSSLMEKTGGDNITLQYPFDDEVFGCHDSIGILLDSNIEHLIADTELEDSAIVTYIAYLWYKLMDRSQKTKFSFLHPSTVSTAWVTDKSQLKARSQYICELLLKNTKNDKLLLAPVNIG